MRQVSLQLIFYVAMITSSIASDFPLIIKSSMPAQDQILWDGFYSGVNAGYGTGLSQSVQTSSYPIYDLQRFNNYLNNPLVPSTPISISYMPVGGAGYANTGTAIVDQQGFIGGFQFGYNRVLTKDFLVGLETDFQGSTVAGSGSYLGFIRKNGQGRYVPNGLPNAENRLIGEEEYLGYGKINARVNWIGTVRGRMGWLVTHTLLVYGTAGLAYGGIHLSSDNYTISQGTVTAPFYLNGIRVPGLGFDGGTDPGITSPGNGTYSKPKIGWTTGGGFEWMFNDNWSVKTEAIYYDLGNATVKSGWMYSFIGSNFSTAIQQIHETQSIARYNGLIARAGINYHFNFGAPVIAKF